MCICAAVVAFLASVVFSMHLLGSLRAAGVITAPTKEVAQAAAPYQAQATMPQDSSTNQSDLDKTLATLAAALAADLNSRRQTGSDPQSDQNRSIVNRSEGQ